jgi:hypothetical protein
LDLWFKSYEVFKISAQVWARLQPLPMQQNLPKSAQSQNFEMSPKMDILVFLKNKKICDEEALEHVFTIWIFNLGIFHMLFLLSKYSLSM